MPPIMPSPGISSVPGKPSATPALDQMPGQPLGRRALLCCRSPAGRTILFLWRTAGILGACRTPAISGCPSPSGLMEPSPSPGSIIGIYLLYQPNRFFLEITKVRVTDNMERLTNLWLARYRRVQGGGLEERRRSVLTVDSHGDPPREGINLSFLTIYFRPGSWIN